MPPIVCVFLVICVMWRWFPIYWRRNR